MSQSPNGSVLLEGVQSIVARLVDKGTDYWPRPGIGFVAAVPVLTAGDESSYSGLTGGRAIGGLEGQGGGASAVASPGGGTAAGATDACRGPAGGGCTAAALEGGCCETVRERQGELGERERRAASALAVFFFM